MIVCVAYKPFFNLPTTIAFLTKSLSRPNRLTDQASARLALPLRRRNPLLSLGPKRADTITFTSLAS